MTKRAGLSLKTATSIVSFIALVVPVLAWQKSKPAQKPPVRSDASGPQKPRPDANRQQDDIPTSDDTVRLGTELVDLLFTAVDRNNHIIGDVRREDVTVLEDGRPQQVFTFKRETNSADQYRDPHGPLRESGVYLSAGEDGRGRLS